MPEPPHILLMAPEASSDVAAALLAERLMARHGARISAAGRSALRATGAHMVQDTSWLGQVGLAAVLASVPLWWEIGRHVVGFVRSERPDAMVLFACRRFHLIFLGALHGKAPPVAWAYPPGDWVQSDDRDEEVLQSAGLFISAFEWQAARLGRQGARVVRVPHHSTLPLPSEASPAEAVAALPRRSDDSPVLGIMPGSRPDEVRRLMPILAEALRLLAADHPGLQAIVSQAPGVRGSRLARHLGGLPCPHVVSRLPVRVIAERADVAIACCGTASTEVAVADCPQVIVYKPAWLTAKAMQRLGKRKDIRFLSMLNLGMDQRVAPELLHSDCTPERIATEVARLLGGADARAQMRSLYARFRQAMSHGSWDEAADAIVELARSPRPLPSP